MADELKRLDGVCDETLQSEGSSDSGEIQIPGRPDMPLAVRRWSISGDHHTPRTLSSLSLERSGSLSSIVPFQLAYGVHSIQGKRATMEDAHQVPLCPDDEVTFFGVFDGHGGQRCADFAAEHLVEFIKESQPYIEQRDLTEAALAGFERLESAWAVRAYEEDLSDGTTAVLAAVQHDLLVIANVGDSEAVLCRAGAPMPLTTIHNPKKNSAEAERVLAAGGRIWRDRVGHPVWNPALVSIAVSRAIGDLPFKKGKYTNELSSGLIATPDTQSVRIGAEDEFVVLACDGLWDVCTHKEVVDYVLEKRAEASSEQLSQLLVDWAHERGSTDNITALVILFMRE